ncbi:MAG TPA: capsid cement protein [Thermoguttaceae bacterium]|nr:capsid cement protein [Thermoguttaceae bacterium]
MSDKMRWRYGDTNPVVAAVDSATVIEIGDLLWLDTDDAKPASGQTDQGTKTGNQDTLADNFLGVAMQRSVAGDTTPIRVATTGVFEFACPSGTFELGDLVGVDEDTGGTTLLDQQVDTVAASEYAVARVARRESSATTSVLVDIRSTIMTGGIEGTSRSGV